jgi:hypothetical protein
MLKESKIGEVVIVAQTTYYVYETQEKREKDEYFMCTSDAKRIRSLKKKLKEATIIHKDDEKI